MEWIIENRIKKNSILIIINNKMNVVRMPKKHYYNMSECYKNNNYDFIDINNINTIDLNNYKLIVIDQYSLPIDFAHKTTINFNIDKMINILPKKVKILLMMEDLDKGIYNDFTELQRLFDSINCIGIISYYDNPNLIKINKMKNNLSLHHLPHHINTDIFKDYGLKKEIDILFYGAKNPSLYPLRGKLWALLSGDMKKKI